MIIVKRNEATSPPDLTRAPGDKGTIKDTAFAELLGLDFFFSREAGYLLPLDTSERNEPKTTAQMLQEIWVKLREEYGEPALELDDRDFARALEMSFFVACHNKTFYCYEAGEWKRGGLPETLACANAIWTQLLYAQGYDAGKGPHNWRHFKMLTK